MKKIIYISLLSFLSVSSAHLQADGGGNAQPVHNSYTGLGVLKAIGFAGLGSIVYTYLKTPSEVVADHNNVLLNFFDNTWCGNWEKKDGYIIDNNRVRPYIIPARGFIGTSMKYFWPALSLVAIYGAWYGISRLAPLFFSMSDAVSDKAAHAIVPRIPVPNGARIVRMDG